MMTKTELHLINEAEKRGGVFHVDTVFGRGGEGGRIRAGTRDRKALSKLIAKKRAKILSEETHIEYNNGWGLHFTTTLFQLVDDFEMPSDEVFLAALGPCGK